jgi:iron complex transport system permease protein
VHRLPPIPVIVALAAASLCALVAALTVGSVTVTPAALVAALTGDASDVAATVVRDLRLPRALCAFAVGGLLAVAGSLMQVLLRNPLADPYVLGLSGGAACGALLAILAGLASFATPARAPRSSSCSDSRAAATRGRPPACC